MEGFGRVSHSKSPPIVKRARILGLVCLPIHEWPRGRRQRQIPPGSTTTPPMLQQPQSSQPNQNSSKSGPDYATLAALSKIHAPYHMNEEIMAKYFFFYNNEINFTIPVSPEHPPAHAIIVLTHTQFESHPPPFSPSAARIPAGGPTGWKLRGWITGRRQRQIPPGSTAAPPMLQQPQSTQPKFKQIRPGLCHFGHPKFMLLRVILFQVRTPAKYFFFDNNEINFTIPDSPEHPPAHAIIVLTHTPNMSCTHLHSHQVLPAFQPEAQPAGNPPRGWITGAEWRALGGCNSLGL
ncbi:hypothetical protein Pelo_17029 [Pelomyxa schiedti]|nr:hypothetical protein Pelo_17029 [Pelomyxa schiedti]